ncbi:MAG: phospholipid carrier-dependent glycosyltransferase, partial [Candidatus Limnocylindria bacterium]
VLADAGVAWMLFIYSRRFLHRRFGTWSGERVGLVAAAVYLCNPGTIFDSAVWGQVDSVGALAVLATLYWLARGWTEAAAVGAVLAMLIKFQFAFMIPIVAIVGLKRHVLGASRDPAQAGRPDGLRVLTSLAAGLGSLVVLLWPFGMAVWSPGDSNRSLIGKFWEAANTYKGLTINGFNLWRNPWSGLGDTITWGCDVPNPPNCTDGAGVAFVLGSADVTWQLIGTLLFAVAALVALWLVARRDDPVGLLHGSLLLAVAFFAVPTRVHERYLFPALALAAPLVNQAWHVLRGRTSWIAAGLAAATAFLIFVYRPGGALPLDALPGAGVGQLAVVAVAAAVPLALGLWGGAALYGLLSVSFFANVYWVYTADWSFVEGPPVNPGVNGEPMVRDPFLAATVFSSWGVFAISFMIVVVLGVATWRAARLAWVAPPEPVPEPGREPVTTVPVEAGAAAAEPWDEGGDSPFERLRRWLRPDPADPYLREGGRRLDRLDLALVIGLVLLAFAFRLWRLDTPRSMHFDEVYHARSATEWLADWQEGWTRDTYEWTHPMLAKYLIAAGIVVADPNRAVGTVELEAPASSIAVAPQRSAFNRPESILFASSGDRTITARALPSGDLLASWEASAAVTSLAYDEDRERLLVGAADDGRVASYLLSAFTAARGERAPPPQGPGIETGLAGVSQVVLPDGGAVILVRGPDGIVEVEGVTGAELARTDLAAASVGYLPGAEDAAAMVVATDPARGVLALLDGSSLQPLTEVVDGETIDLVRPLPAAPAGPLQVRGRGTDAQVWVPVGALPANDEHPEVAGGITVFDEEADLIGTAPLPGAPRVIGWQPVANIIYIAGTGGDSGQPELWTVQPIGSGGRQSAGFAAFDTTPLPGEPLALAFDVSDHRQDDDHGRLIVSTATGAGGELVQVDAGSNAFAWRLAGIAFGSVLAALIYLLAATMFSRRRVAVLAGAFVAFDAMSYVMSRISMNDIFVATFIAGAYLVFWQVWSGRWERSAWWALPLVGVLIGLAAASKWVGIYALAGLWLLVLARSGLGRFLLVGGIGFVTVVAGFGAPWPFLVVCLLALGLALLVTWARPTRLAPRDLLALPASGVILAGVGMAFATAYNQLEEVEGAPHADNAVELVFAVLARGAQAAWPAWLLLGLAGALLLARAVKSLVDPDSDRRWFQPAELGGFGWSWVGASLAVIPLLVYFLSYVPYLQLGHPIAGPNAGPGYGWSLEELHAQMFGYHFGLQAGHAASSPWWSWPLELKTVFFYTHDFDDRAVGVIYNGGNPVLFWAGVPAMVWCGILAWRRRSPALVLLVVAFAFQFLPWTRIERATFQYHYLTAVIFAMVAVAYVTDEALRSWTWRPLGIAFLVLAAVAGVLVFPMGSALAMPDWYINLARTLPPWNFNFVFPDPPQGSRGELISADSLKLALGTLVGVSAAAFSLFGRDLFARGRPAGALPGGGLPHGDHHQQDAQDHQAYRPQQLPVEAGDVLVDQEPDPQPHQDEAEDHRPA